MHSVSTGFVALCCFILPLVYAAGNALQQTLSLGTNGIPSNSTDDHHFAHTHESVFNFNVDWHRNSERLVINEVTDRSTFSQITGSIVFARGDAFQEDDVVVLVRTSSDSEDALNRLFARAEKQELTIGSTLGHDQEDTFVPVMISVVVFVRPHCLQMGSDGTTVKTENLDIAIWPSLEFETYYMSLTTLHGTITSSETVSFTAHEITLVAAHGDIIGNWSLPSAIRFTTHVGNIDIDLIPKRWSAGPWTKADLHAEASSGNVIIRMPFERDSLSLRNGTTIIRTGKGMISGHLVHGGSTTILSQGYESINLTLLPYWAFSEWQGIQFNHLKTNQLGGDMQLKVLPPIIDGFYKVNPLCLMRSSHKSINGSMKLSYPREWCGTAVGNATIPGEGHVSISGEDYETIVDEPHHVEVKRRPFGSHLYFETVSGSADLLLR